MSTSTIPLEQLDLGMLPALGRELWGWPECICTIGRSCNQDDCTARVKRLTRYFQFCKGMITAYIDESFPTTRVFQTHQDLNRAIRVLKEKPNITRSEFGAILTKNASIKAISDATTLTVQILTMIDCSPLHCSFDVLEQGSASRITWRDAMPLNEYILDVFPKNNHHILSFPNTDVYNDFTLAIRARKLQKHLGITIRPTRDLCNHLHFDRKNNIVYVFHHTAYLKEQLKAIKERNRLESITCTKELLPRQLLLETLTSLQEILFPLSDPESRTLLYSLIETSAFDPDASVYVYDSIRSDIEDSQAVAYIYLADRIADLHAEMQNPSPRGWLERTLERKSGGRHIMMATLGGVIFAVVLGLLSFGVSLFQAWVSYQAWKYPVNPSN